MEKFIQAKLRIIALGEHLRKLRELFSLLEVKAQLYKVFETEGCTLNDILWTVYTIQICKYKVVGHRCNRAGPYGTGSRDRPLPHILCCSSSLRYLDNSM